MTKNHSLISFLLLAAYLLQDIYQWKWLWLMHMQEDFIYKQITGFLMCWFVLEEWRLFFLHSQHKMAAVHIKLQHHRKLGIAAPVFLYFHAHALGYGYLLLLSSVYLTTFVLGFLYPPTFSLRQKWLCSGWIVCHVSLASVLLLMIGEHIYIAYLYE